MRVLVSRVRARARARSPWLEANSPPHTHIPPLLVPLSVEMKVTHAEMREARLPIAMRDYCAHLLIPLNKCRQATMYLPWKCGHERHEYEKCEYVEHLLAQKRKVESS